SDPEGLDLAVKFVDRVARPEDLHVAARELGRLSASAAGGFLSRWTGRCSAWVPRWHGWLPRWWCRWRASGCASSWGTWSWTPRTPHWASTLPLPRRTGAV